MIKPISGLFLIFWGAVKVYQGWVIFEVGVDFGAAVILLGLLAAAVGGLFIRDSLS